jgi:hypothetical protein
MTSNPTCHVCDERIIPGERRFPDVDDAGHTQVQHWACGSLSGNPHGVLGQVTPGDLFKICFDGSTWHYASVEGQTTAEAECVIRGILRNSEFRHNVSSPVQFSSQFDIVTTPHGNSWSDPVAFEVEPDWPAIEQGPGRSFEYDRHSLGTARVRPVSGEGPPTVDSFWDPRPTSPAHLHQRYVVEKATIAELAQELRVSEWTVRNWMDRADIDRRGVAPDIELQARKTDSHS